MRLFGKKLLLEENGPEGPIDLGRVGEVTAVDVPPIENLCLAGVVPVLPSLAEDEDEELEGRLLNVNADTRRRGRGPGTPGREARLPHRYVSRILRNK